MPSSATITTFYEFQPLTSIRSSQVNNNFSLFRGHLVPIEPLTATAADLTYDLGSDDYSWRGLYASHAYLYQHSVGSEPANPSAGKMALYFKEDGTLYKKNSAGTETAVGSGGGGGGSSVNWIPDANAPTAVFEYSSESYVFTDGLEQCLYAAVRVPSSFAGGSQVNLRGIFYASGTSDTILFQTVATLIRTGTDAISSTTNQRTSTNSAVTLATTANRPNAFVCDLTDADGLVNGVTATAGDLILVKLTRMTGTSSLDAIVPVYASEVTFT